MLNRTTYKKLKNNIANRASGMLAACGRGVANLRLVRWLAACRPVRVTVGVGALLWALFGKYLWRPGKRTFRRTYRHLGRREVLVYIVVWAFCALLGFVTVNTWVTLSPMYLKILVGGVVLVAFTLVCFASPLTGLLAYLLTAPLLKALINIRLVESQPTLSVNTVCFGTLLLAYIFQPKKAAECQPTRLLHLFMWLFVLGQLVAAWHAERLSSAQMVIHQYLLPILIYFYARRWITNMKQLRAFFVILLVMGAYFIGFAIPEHFTGRNILSFTGRSMYIEADLGIARAQGPAADPQEFGLVMSLVAATALVQFTYESAKYKRMLMILITIAAFVGIGYTLRRSAYVGAFLNFTFLLAGSQKVRKAAMLGLGIGVIILAANWSSLRNSELYSKRLATVLPVYSRAVVHATAYNIFLHRPWFGMGFDRYGEGNRLYLVAYKDIMPWYGAGFTSPHSSYWRILVDGGLIGFIPFVLMIVMCFLTAFRILKRTRAPGVLGRDGIIIFVGYMIGVLAQAATTDSFFYHRYLIIVWMCYLGALVGAHLRTQETDAPLAADESKPILRSPKRFVHT